MLSRRGISTRERVIRVRLEEEELLSRRGVVESERRSEVESRAIKRLN